MRGVFVLGLVLTACHGSTPAQPVAGAEPPLVLRALTFTSYGSGCGGCASPYEAHGSSQLELTLTAEHADLVERGELTEHTSCTKTTTWRRRWTGTAPRTQASLELDLYPVTDHCVEDHAACGTAPAKQNECNARPGAIVLTCPRKTVEANLVLPDGPVPDTRPPPVMLTGYVCEPPLGDDLPDRGQSPYPWVFADKDLISARHVGEPEPQLSYAPGTWDAAALSDTPRR